MKRKSSIFVTHAVKEEFIPIIIDGYEVSHIYTGVGKTKSACILTKHICMNKPDLILNVGTAGTLNHQVGDIFVSTHFIDRDYESIRLPGLEHEIDGLPLLSRQHGLRQWLKQYDKTGICNTGDSFVTRAESLMGDIVDMEAYAQAFVCKEFDVPFISVKYITDIIGENSVGQWESRLTEARNRLALWFEQQMLLKALL